MKIAFIISEAGSLAIGGCLSSAKVFYIYDKLSDSYFTLELPNTLKDQQIAKTLSVFLKESGITHCVGKDLGPKAKAALEENEILWFDPQENENKADIIKQILNT